MHNGVETPEVDSYGLRMESPSVNRPYFHHRVNFPCSVPGKILSLV
jgi:hypothetical protein